MCASPAGATAAAATRRPRCRSIAGTTTPCIAPVLNIYRWLALPRGFVSRTPKHSRSGSVSRPTLAGADPGRQRHEPPGGGSKRKDRRRPTLPGPCGPSTIGAVGLNCSVRNGKRCFPHAKATGNRWRPSPAAHPEATGARFPRGPSKPHNPPTNEHQSKIIRQALDPLVPVSCECHHSSRSGLSTWWSTRGLTPSRGWESSSRGRLPA